MLNRSKYALLVIVILIVGVAVVHAAATGSISFLDSSSQPAYQVDGTSLTEDYSECDLVTMMMTDATGQITDIDNFCLGEETVQTLTAGAIDGSGYDYTDWGSYDTGYIPTMGPITYSVFDTADGDACDNSIGDENSVECSALLLSGAVTCLDEDYYQPGSLPVGTAYPVCARPATTASCPYPLPVGSRVYSVPAGAPTFWAASLDAQTTFNLPAGTWYISEFSGDFAKVWIACQARMVWIPANAVAR